MIKSNLTEIQLDVESVRRGQPFDINLKVRVADENLFIEGAYLLIEGVEIISVPKNRQDKNKKNLAQKEMLSNMNIITKQRIKVANEKKLEANERYVWDAKAQLASDCQPSYHGKYCNYFYRVKAYLDCCDNAADSGWINLAVL